MVYDPAEASFETLLDLFFEKHDPTQLNRQGNDVGTQYRWVPGVGGGVAGVVLAVWRAAASGVRCCGCTRGAAVCAQSWPNPNQPTPPPVLLAPLPSQPTSKLPSPPPPLPAVARSSGVYYTTPEQKAVAEAVMARVNQRLSGQVVTELEEAKKFWPAEEYHQQARRRWALLSGLGGGLVCSWVRWLCVGSVA